MNITQIKKDLDNGVMVCSSTWRELVEWAVKVEENAPPRIAPLNYLTQARVDELIKSTLSKPWVVAETPNEVMVRALQEIIDQHDNGIAGISKACIDRARAALSAVGAKDPL